MKRLANKSRQSEEELIEHYEVEKELAQKLRNANKEERKKLYSTLYDEYCIRLKHNPQYARKTDSKRQKQKVAKRLNLLKKFLTPKTIFLELGPGDCSLSMEVAKHVAKVFAIDVSEEITKSEFKPANFELIISDGSSIDLPSESVDVAYSNQLMEHLHPDDAVCQLENVLRTLVPGGYYICITPHRFMGPYDISEHFDDVATGFHLKEYSNSELYRLFNKTGFSKVYALRHISSFYMNVPIFPILLLESLLSPLPFSLRRRIARAAIFKDLLSTTVVAVK